MRTSSALILILLTVTGCQFSKSVKKDLVSGLTTKGNVLTCEDVYLTVNDERTTRNSFIFGEMLTLNYDDIRGFTKENGNVFPLMEIIVTDRLGDTLLYTDELYSKYPEGMNYTPLQLTADLTVASPIYSNGEYTMSVNISDRKGSGTYSSALKFSVKPNDKIITEKKGTAEYDEVYIYSQGGDKVITDGKIGFNDNIYVIVEGLKGFREEKGYVFPGLSLKSSDSEKNMILDNDDMFTEYTETGVAASDLASRVSSHFNITGSEFKNPLHTEMVIWDKKSSAKLTLSTDLTVE
jgi:hypothetical protein